MCLDVVHEATIPTKQGAGTIYLAMFTILITRSRPLGSLLTTSAVARIASRFLSDPGMYPAPLS